MRSYFFEASHGGTGNWGKFMIGEFGAIDWTTPSALPEASDQLLLRGRGWGYDHVLFVDLQTGEGAILKPGGVVKADLEKHAIWVCPMAEPFLEWFYAQDRSNLGALPRYVELPDAPFAMSGYRRPGPLRDAAERAWAFLASDWNGTDEKFATEERQSIVDALAQALNGA